MPELPSVSVIVPVLDEIAVFDTAIQSVICQRYEGQLEFIFVDGGSRDGTRERLVQHAESQTNVTVLDNPRPGIPASLNIGLKAASGEIVVRMDAHTEYAVNYVASGVEAVHSGRADWAGGPAIAHGDGAWSRHIALALTSKLGVGGADFRLTGEERLTDAAFGGAIHRVTLLELGGWDENWVVNEDGELAARASAAGLRILLVPAMSAKYIPRDDLPGLARQYARYGFWRAKTSVAHPQSTRASHLIPPALALTAAASVRSPSIVRRIARAGLFVYAVAVIAESARLARVGGSRRDTLKLAAVFSTMHMAWGAANVAGFKRFGSPLPAIRSVLQRL